MQAVFISALSSSISNFSPAALGAQTPPSFQNPPPVERSSIFGSRQKHTHTMSHVYVALSLLGICTLAGAGVAVGSGVGFAMMAAAEEEAKAKAGSAGPIAAASVVEKKSAPNRGFAASN
ncbi:hypothetical protein WJX81_005895 [Elliptochloris bilobata]|uniref:Uncharacterized protein n=1 Tax=Elliptochloris bilobata TaxID=381761 RepID=A0AAW1RX32_9CHLO